MTLDNNIAFIFPGQGSQYKGIGSDLFDEYDLVREIYQTASDTLGYDMAELSFKDPQDKIDLTRYTQPVLLTHSYACLSVFKQHTRNTVVPILTAGHSLGEYTALVATGALTFEQALKLVSKRGELMGEYGEGEMEALPFSADEARALAEQHYCAVAACNLKDQTVVGGRNEDLDRLVGALAESHPKKRTARLKTEGAFHTYYMVKAAQLFREVLDDVEFSPAAFKVMSNYTGATHDNDTTSIKSRLFLQLFYPVLWHANLMNAADQGATTFVEFGGGLGQGESPADKRANLEGIVKKAFRGSENKPIYHCVINAATLTASAAALTDSS